VIGHVGSAAAIETHSASLFFFGDRVYKVKKPVDLGFLDFRTEQGRAAACRREVELNRRLAPDVYLGVAQMTDPDGQVCEHLVVMRRMPPHRRLRACLERGEDVHVALERIADELASLHDASPPPGPMESVATRDAIRRLWCDGFDSMRPHVGTLLGATDQQRIEELVLRFLAGRAPLFEQRIRDGAVRDGHGDLQAEDIFLLDDGPRVLDCLEFDDALRWGDVLGDAAFLAMDLERFGRPELARLFLDAFDQRSGIPWPPALEHHYVAYRAHVRAKVGVIRAGQGAGSTAEVDRLQALCRRHLEAARVRAVLVGGLPGTGKTTLSRRLAERVDAVVLRSDELRRRLPEAVRYAPATTDEVYADLLAEAEHHLAHGRHVVLDATWSAPEHRRLARTVADRVAADVVEIECVAPAGVTVERIRHRLAAGVDLSEATPEVAEQMARRFGPWPEAERVRTDLAPEDSTRSALLAFG